MLRALKSPHASSLFNKFQYQTSLERSVTEDLVPRLGIQSFAIFSRKKPNVVSVWFVLCHIQRRFQIKIITISTVRFHLKHLVILTTVAN